ncbi:hypothetical protein NHJ6243_009635 [Beauveria neobassiana]
MADSHYVGERISYDDALCTVRYTGEVAGASGSWLGVEWDDGTRGKHDGISESPTAASFVRPARPADTPVSFVTALKTKYVEKESEASGVRVSQIRISGKVAEDVGFDKVRRQMARLDELKMAILDGVHMAFARQEGEPLVAQISPKLSHIDISRNLFENLGPVVDICKDLPALKKLAINGNRFQKVLEDAALDNAATAFSQVTELGIGDNMLSWRHASSADLFPRLYLYIGGALFSTTSVFWLASISYRNRSGFSTARITYDNGAIKVSLQLSRPLKVKAGQYISLWVPWASLGSAAQTHPFTVISWSEKPQRHLDLFIEPRGGFTKNLFALSDHGPTTRRAMFSGPHGKQLPVHSYI